MNQTESLSNQHKGSGCSGRLVEEGVQVGAHILVTTALFESVVLPLTILSGAPEALGPAALVTACAGGFIGAVNYIARKLD